MRETREEDEVSSIEELVSKETGIEINRIDLGSVMKGYNDY